MSDETEFASQEMLDTFFSFVAWTFEKPLNLGQRARVEIELRRRWSSGDGTEIDLFNKVLHADKKRLAAQPADHPRLRQDARSYFSEASTDASALERHRVVRVLIRELDGENMKPDAEERTIPEPPELHRNMTLERIYAVQADYWDEVARIHAINGDHTEAELAADKRDQFRARRRKVIEMEQRNFDREHR